LTFCLLRQLHRKFSCDISMYICIITRISSSLFFSSLPYLPSYGGFNRFKISILILA
jgi:hypothetical protein